MLAAYRRWLHAQWPAGTVEPLPQSGPGGATAIPGVRIIGDLAGTSLLKSSAASGASAITLILAEKGFKASVDPDVLDVAILGGGLAGNLLARQLLGALPELAIGLFERETSASYKVGEATVEISWNEGDAAAACGIQNQSGNICLRFANP